MKDKNGVEIQRGDRVKVSISAGVVGLNPSGTVSVRIPYVEYALEPEQVEVDLNWREPTD